MHFGVLGSLVVRDGEDIRPMAAPKQRIILVSLLLRAGQIVSVDDLTEQIWGEAPPVGSRKLIHGYVMRLRQTLGPGGGKLLISRSPGYLLDIAEASFDLREFRGAVAAGRDAADAGKWPESAAHLRRALRNIRGRPLLDIPSTVLQRNHGPYLNELGIQAHEAHTEAEIHLGQCQAAAARLAELATSYPTRESLHLQLMTVLGQRGLRIEALDVYRQLRRALVDELGIEPSPELQDLHRQLLQDGSIGTTTTRNLQRREVGDNHPINMTAVESRLTDRVPRLPPTAWGFSGRVAELKRLSDLVAPDGSSATVPVVIVSGMGGVGKTALALHWANSVVKEYPDGQIYLDLLGHSQHDRVSPAEALATILQTLGVRPDQIPADPIAAAALYRSRVAGRNLLILFDNARSAEQIRPLLPVDYGCVVIVTSRHRLGDLQVLDGARCMDLDALYPAEAELLLAGLLSNRARAEPDAIAEIARLCAYLPLALRIASARLAEQPDRGVAWIRDELAGDDRLGALQLDGNEDVAVRAAFDMSYRLMAPDLRRLFALLGLIPGASFSIETVAAVSDLSRSAGQRGMGRLAAVHMVRIRSDGRYDLHDLLREYAREIVATSEETALAYDRLYSWYCHCSRAAMQKAYRTTDVFWPKFRYDASALIGSGFADDGQANAWLNLEFGQLAAAIHNGVQNGQAAAAIYIACILRRYMLGRTSLADWLAIADAALAAALTLDDVRAQAEAHLSAGAAYGSRDNYIRSIEQLEPAYKLAHRSNWIDGEMLAQHSLGLNYALTGRLTASHQAYLHVIDVSTRAGNEYLAAYARCNIGHVLIDLGRPEEAIEWTAEALDRARHLPNQGLTANSLDCYGLAYYEAGQYDLALPQLTEAYRLSLQLGDEGLEAITLAHLAQVAAGQGHHVRAWELAHTAAALPVTAGRPRIEAIVLNVVALLHICDGHGDRAKQAAARSYDLAKLIGCRSVEIEALMNRASAHRLSDETNLATDVAHLAYDLAQAGGYASLAKRCIDLLDKLRCDDTGLPSVRGQRT